MLSSPSVRNRVSPVTRVVLGVALVWSIAPTQQTGRGLRITPPPPPVGTTSYSVGDYKIHVFENPGARQRNPDERSVLVLGTFSDPDAVLKSRNFIDPHTDPPRRFDVIVGLGADNILAEARRVVLEDHLNADRNAAALRSAISQHFGGPLAAGTLTTHSNGTTVGIGGILNGAFQNVKKLNALGPDIGYGGTYLDRQSLADLRQAGVQSVDVYRNRGDIVPALGRMSALLGDAVLGVNLAIQANKSLRALMDIVTVPRNPGLPAVRQFVLQTDFGFGFRSHYAENYLNSIAGMIKDPGTAAPATAPQAAGPADEKGVRIFIDDELLAKSLAAGTSQDNERLFERLARSITDGSEENAVDEQLAGFSDALKMRYKTSRTQQKIDNLAAVSLKTLIERAEAYAGRWGQLPPDLREPGALTRIVGYVVDRAKNDILLVGRTGRDGPSIELDDLIVGIRSVWSDRSTPRISLDPDPADPTGPQRVRIQGIPTDSKFARTMIEADYLMKRIMAGVEAVPSPRFLNFKQILERDRPGETQNRFWLYPLQPQAGDIQISGDGRAVLFATGAQVLSEELQQMSEGFVGKGRTMASAEEAAMNFTRHYADIERRLVVFRKLQGLFDIVLLARIWQSLRLDSSLPDRLAALPSSQVDIPESFEAIMVEMEDGWLSGGVEAQLGAGPRTWLVLDDPELDSLKKTSSSLSASGRLSASYPDLSVHIAGPDLRRRDTLSLGWTTAFARLSAGDAESAMGEITRLVGADPYDPKPIALRALIGFFRNDLLAARDDAQLARAMDPNDPFAANLSSLVLYQCHALAGKAEAALREVDYALRNNPDSVSSRVFRASALQDLGMTSEARAEYKRAIEVDPNSALAHAKLGLLEISEGWVVKGKGLIDKARALTKLGRDDPQIQVAMALSAMAGAGLGNAQAQLTSAAQHAQGALDNPACGPASAIGALCVLSGVAMIRQEWEKADNAVQRARKLAPFFPGPLISAAEFAHEAKRDDLAARYLAEAERLAPGLPAIKALRAKIGR